VRGRPSTAPAARPPSAGTDNDIVIPDVLASGVSRYLVLRPGRADSRRHRTNGTFVNANRSSTHPWQGDVVTIGNLDLYD